MKFVAAGLSADPVPAPTLGTVHLSTDCPRMMGRLFLAVMVAALFLLAAALALAITKAHAPLMSLFGCVP
jgi:hypothetical protein